MRRKPSSNEFKPGEELSIFFFFLSEHALATKKLRFGIYGGTAKKVKKIPPAKKLSLGLDKISIGASR